MHNIDSSRYTQISTDRYIGIYCRLSPRPDGSYEGVELQEQWGRAYAAAQWPGISVRIFTDAGLSAFKDDVVRPAFNELRAAIARGEVLQLWCVEQSRLERREGPWFTLAAELEVAGLAELHTNRDGVVRVGDVVAGIKAVLNGAEVRKMKLRVNDTLDSRAEKGIPSGSRPYGYAPIGRRESRTYVIVGEQAKMIRWAADRVLAGWSLTHVADELRAQGVHGPHRVKVRDELRRVLLDDGRWVDKHHPAVHDHAVTNPSTVTQQGVRGWLLNPSVAGLRVHRGVIVGPGNWEPILNRQTWEQVRALLTAPRVVKRSDGGEYPVRTSHTGPGGRKYVLTGGLIVCGVCSAPMVGTLKQLRNTRAIRSVRYFVCHPKMGGKGCVGVMLEPVEAHVADELFAKLEAEPDFAAALASDQHAARRAELAGDLAQIQAEREDAAGQKASGEISDGEWQAMRKAFNRREDKAQRELREIPAPLVEAGGLDWKTMRELWDDPAAELDERRAFVRRHVLRVTVHRARRGAKSFEAARVLIEYREI
jgi:DNA invertase Pin-like site-specific DNA recombinase